MEKPAASSGARGRPVRAVVHELEALAYSRRKAQRSAGRALVDQLLQELDAIGSDNAGLLVLAATDAPWDVDDALKRPGRFGRVVFVPPPDDEARRGILDIVLADRPLGNARRRGSPSRRSCSAAPISTARSSARSTPSSLRRSSRDATTRSSRGHLEGAVRDARPANTLESF